MAALTRDQHRRNRARLQRAGRHRGERGGASSVGFDRSFAALGELAYSGARVSASVLDLETGAPLLSIDDRIVVPIGQAGTVLLLVEASARITTRAVEGLGILDKPDSDAVSGAGLWQRMQVPTLPLRDLGLLVGATGDRLATNVLLREIGMDAIRSRTESFGLSRTGLLDLVRDRRGPDDAPQFSVGSTAELAWLFSALARGRIVDSVTSQRVLEWLSAGSDLSMVASAFGLEPLAHRSSSHGVSLVNITGSEVGLRADVGLLQGPRAGVAYAVTVEFDERGLNDRLRALEALRTVGSELLEYVH